MGLHRRQRILPRRRPLLSRLRHHCRRCRLMAVLVGLKKVLPPCGLCGLMNNLLPKARLPRLGKQCGSGSSAGSTMRPHERSGWPWTRAWVGRQVPSPRVYQWRDRSASRRGTSSACFAATWVCPRSRPHTGTSAAGGASILSMLITCGILEAAHSLGGR